MGHLSFVSGAAGLVRDADYCSACNRVRTTLAAPALWNVTEEGRRTVVLRAQATGGAGEQTESPAPPSSARADVVRVQRLAAGMSGALASLGVAAALNMGSPVAANLAAEVRGIRPQDTNESRTTSPTYRLADLPVFEEDWDLEEDDFDVAEDEEIMEIGVAPGYEMDEVADASMPYRDPHMPITVQEGMDPEPAPIRDNNMPISVPRDLSDPYFLDEDEEEMLEAPVAPPAALRIEGSDKPAAVPERDSNMPIAVPSEAPAALPERDPNWPIAVPYEAPAPVAPEAPAAPAPPPSRAELNEAVHELVEQMRKVMNLFRATGIRFIKVDVPELSYEVAKEAKDVLDAGSVAVQPLLDETRKVVAALKMAAPAPNEEPTDATSAAQVQEFVDEVRHALGVPSTSGTGTPAVGEQRTLELGSMGVDESSNDVQNLAAELRKALGILDASAAEATEQAAEATEQAAKTAAASVELPTPPALDAKDLAPAVKPTRVGFFGSISRRLGFGGRGFDLKELASDALEEATTDAAMEAAVDIADDVLKDALVEESEQTVEGEQTAEDAVLPGTRELETFPLDNEEAVTAAVSKGMKWDAKILKGVSKHNNSILVVETDDSFAKYKTARQKGITEQILRQIKQFGFTSIQIRSVNNPAKVFAEGGVKVKLGADATLFSVEKEYLQKELENRKTALKKQIERTQLLSKQTAELESSYAIKKAKYDSLISLQKLEAEAGVADTAELKRELEDAAGSAALEQLVADARANTLEYETAAKVLKRQEDEAATALAKAEKELAAAEKELTALMDKKDRTSSDEASKLEAAQAQADKAVTDAVAKVDTDLGAKLKAAQDSEMELVSKIEALEKSAPAEIAAKRDELDSKLKSETEAKAKVDAEAKAKAEAEAKAKAEAKAEAEAKAKAEAEAKAKAEAAEKAAVAGK